MKLKNWIAIILALVMLVGILPMGAATEDADKSGTCGPNATWEVSGDWLWIEGTGAMEFDGYYYEAPWGPWENDIRVIHIGEGITEAWGFETCRWAENIFIPSTLQSLDYGEFSNMPVLQFFSVNENNKVYSAHDGVLFTKDQTTLLRCPGGYRGIYTVPETVTTIAEGAFSGCKTLLEVTLPEGLTEIGTDTFAGCSSLNAVKLPQSLKKIRARAFENCISLVEADLPMGLTAIEAEAFSNTGLRSVVIPDSVGNYGGAFSFCSRLESLTVGKGVLSHLEDDYRCTPALKTVKVSEGNPAYYCDERGVLYSKDRTELLAVPDAMTGEYSVLPGTQIIGYCAFEQCVGIKKVQLPPSVYCIGEQAFVQCTALEEINLEGVMWYGLAALCECESLKEIKLAPQQPFFESYVFSSCGITEVEIPEGYTEIGEDMFSGCSGLKKITIPDTVETIGTGAFMGTAVESITFPRALRTLGGCVLKDCENLKEISFPKENENFFVDTSGVVYNADKTELLFATSLTDDLIILADTIEYISEGAFGLGTVRTVVIPETVTEYEYLYNLRGDSIESFVVEDTNPAFTEGAEGGLYNKDQTCLLRLPQGFQGAYYAPEQLFYIESDAFAGCEGLTEVHVGKALGDPDSQIPDMVYVPAFYVSQDHPGYYNDEKGVLYSADGTRLIYAPKDLEGEYVIPHTVTKIYPYAFQDCNKLTAVDLSACAVQTIPEGAFGHCTALEEVRFPEMGLKTVEAYAFSGCSGLKEIELPGGVARLEAWSFGECSALEKVILPYSLMELDHAFYDCENLKTVRFGGNMPICDFDSFMCFDEETRREYIAPKLTIEYRYYGYYPRGFTTPYCMGIPTRLHADPLRDCVAEGCTCAHFTDMPAIGNWAHYPLEEMVNDGLVNGVGNNRLNPNGSMTRAMLVTILYRQAGEPAVGACPFTDVPADTWYTDAVTWAAEEGLVNGVGNGLFAPDRPITREQIATILARTGGVDQGESGEDLGWLGYFSDGDTVSDYAWRSVAYMVGLGIMNGKGAKLDPQGIATRAEVATILWRWREFAPDFHI